MPTNPRSPKEVEDTGPQSTIQSPSLATQNSAEPADSGAEPPEKTPDESGKSTTPLPDLQSEPSPALAPGSVVGERYQVESLLQAGRDGNVYRVVDQQGYRHCWACGSDSSMQGDMYCVECGAQLAGRNYRLQEFQLPESEEKTAANANTAPLAQAILENSIPGVARVYDTIEVPGEQRLYVVWEEAYGRTMASWLPESEGQTTLPALSGQLAPREEPDEEQALAWMAQAADLLARLHGAGIVACRMTLDNLLVQPGDRLILLDPSACRATPSEPPPGPEQDAAEAADVRNLASELERWYIVVRKNSEQTEEPTVDYTSAPPQNDANLTSFADEATGPLNDMSNPAVLLTRAREGVYPTAESLAEALRELHEASKPLTNLQLWTGRASNIGRVRQINEDSLLTLEATVLEHEGNLSVGVYVVADGMGGHQSGEVASAISARTIGAIISSSLVSPLVAGDPVARDLNTCAGLLRQSALEANRRIADLARERSSDLGTTTVAALIVGNQLSVANIGDSRAYLWRDGQLSALTRDHSLVAQLVATGQIKPEEIYTHPRRNEIYRALGDPRLTAAEVDLYNHHLRPGDGLLICSDGLWDFVRDPLIAQIIAEHESEGPQAICNALVDKANQAGGEDNISVIFIQVVTNDS